MSYASRDPRPLAEIAIIDQDTIDWIAAQVPPGGLTISQIKADTDIADSLTKKHASGSDNQDLSGLEPKQTGKSLSTNDYITADKNKLAGIEAGANNYSHPANHAPSVITQDVSNRFVSDTEKGTWNGKEPGNSNIQTHVTAAHAPTGAQVNADITKAEIEAKLTGELTSHSHATQTFRCGVATKNINDASTVQNIAHGLGRIPKIVRVKADAAYTAALSMIVTGAYDGTNHASICLCSAEGTSTALIDNIYNSTAAELGFTAATGTNPYTGANRQTGVITCDATNIIITWTKAGTVASNVVNILWEVS